MPIVHRVHPEHRLVIAVAYGVLTDEDVFNFQHTVWADPGVAGYSELGDMTHVTDIAIPSIHRVRDLAMTAAEMDMHEATARFAIVAPEDLGYGLGRMFQAYREMEKASRKEVGVFRMLDEAFAWLEIRNPPAMPKLPKGARHPELGL
jgi:hypothetical protein